MIEPNPGETVTAQNKERITPRQPLRFFPDAAPVNPRKLGKGIVIHINEAGQRRVTWADKGSIKAVKQWMPRDKNGEQKVGPVVVDATSCYRATQARVGDGPWSTYEVGESSGPTKELNEREFGPLKENGPKVFDGPNKGPLISIPNGSKVFKGPNKRSRISIPKVADIGPNRDTFGSLPNLTAKENRTGLTGGGYYQLSVDWDLVEAFIPTNRGTISEVPVRIAVDFLSQRSFRILDRENSFLMDWLETRIVKLSSSRGGVMGDSVSYGEGPQGDIEQEPLEPAANRSMILASSMDDNEVLDVSPLRTYYGEITQGEQEQSEWVQQHMTEFSKLMGVAIEGFESEAMRLFVAIERRWRQNGGTGVAEKEPTQKSRKGLRELRNLECSVNYESSQKMGGGRRLRGAVISQ